MNVRLLTKLLHEIRKQVDNEMSVQKLELLALCLSNPDGIDQHAMYGALDQSRSAVSKNIADLSALTSKKVPGPGLLRSDTDPMNLTIRRITVTPKGQRVWDSIVKKAGG